MESNKYVKVFKAGAVTTAAFLLNYMIQLVLTPFITKTVGAEAYGYVTLAKNFAQYAAIITAALNSFASRYIAIAYHKHDRLEANRFFSSAFFGDTALATTLFLIAVLVIVFLEKLLQIPAALVADVKLLFLYVFINFWVITVFTVFESAAYIKSKLSITGMFKGLSYLTEAAVLYVLYLLMPARVSYVGIGLIAASVVIALGNWFICKRYTPELTVQRKDFSLQAVKRLVIDGIWTSVNSLGDILNSGLDLVVCNLMLTPLHMSHVAVAKTVHTMLSGLFVIINPVFQPMFLKSYAEKKTETMMEEFRSAMKLSGMLANIAFGGFLALGLSFFRLWIPNLDTQLIYELTLINCLTLVAGGSMQPLFYIYTLTAKRKIPSLITIAGGLLNVAGMYILIRYTTLGVYAVVWTTAVVMLAINLITNPLYMAHVLGMPWYTFYPEVMRNLLSCGVVTAVFHGMSRLYQPDTWLALIACACIYAMLGALLHALVVFGKREWRKLGSIIRRRG